VTIPTADERHRQLRATADVYRVTAFQDVRRRNGVRQLWAYGRLELGDLGLSVEAVLVGEVVSEALNSIRAGGLIRIPERRAANGKVYWDNDFLRLDDAQVNEVRRWFAGRR
jgi:hypothetical protein